MKSNIHSRGFFLQWQLLCAASNPGGRKDRWQVDGVDWTKERLNLWGGDYSVALDIHQLSRKRAGKLDWRLMIVTERWLGPDRAKGIRSSSWSKLISGKPDQVVTWLRKQGADQPSLVDAAN
jgi:hypothetical protein